MQLDQKTSLHIQDTFHAMKEKEDLLLLINFCKQLVYGKQAFPFKLSQLTYYANPNLKKSAYKEFSIAKKDGAKRTIHAPEDGLKAIQRCLNLIFQSIHEPAKQANGFISGRSIISNAYAHTGRHYVFNVDIKDFFGSIDQARIWGRLSNRPFNLKNSKGKKEIVNLLVSLCCHQKEVERPGANGEIELQSRRVLPQGAPTSPVLTNIICERLDYLLNALAKRFNLVYSRYADDITFSSDHNVYQHDSEFTIELNRIIADQGFSLKASKTRLQEGGYRQRVTGIIVNKKVNLSRSYRKEVRMWLYLWRVYGLNRAEQIFLEKNLQGADVKKLRLSEVIRGKLNFLKMVRGAEDAEYLKLRAKFLSLLELENKNPAADKTKIKFSQTLPKIMPFPILHYPKKLVEILRLFTIQNSVLKFATHAWDMGNGKNQLENYDKFIKLAKSEFDIISPFLLGLRPSLRAKMLSFLFKRDLAADGWGTQRVKFGWSSPEVKTFFVENPEGNVETLLLPKYAQMIYRQAGEVKTIQRFKQVIDIFKNEIEIRDDTSALANLILEYHDAYLPGFSISTFENLENKSFFTDVDYMRKTLSIIFESMKNRGQFNSVGYRVEQYDDSLELSITQQQSFCKGLSYTSEKFSLNRGDFSTITSHLMHLCDWSIRTVFEEGCYQLNFLSSNRSTPGVVKTEDCEGFTHLLKFYL